MASGRHSSNFLLPADDELNDTQSVTSSSFYSSNYTMSNLVGPGRVLGNLYSSLGRRLERSIGASAHKAGFGPSATYEKIQEYFETVRKVGHLIERELSLLLQYSYFIQCRLS